MIKALFGIGEEYLAVTPYSASDPTPGHHYRSEIQKMSGAYVSADAFASTGCREVSGVFSTYTDILNVPSDHGSEILFVNNPNAQVHIPEGRFSFGTEFVASKTHVWRAASRLTRS